MAIARKSGFITIETEKIQLNRAKTIYSKMTTPATIDIPWRNFS